MVLPRRKKRREKRPIFDKEAAWNEFIDLWTGAFGAIFRLGEIIPEMQARLKDLPGTNYRAGMQYYNENRINDALMRFRVAEWFDNSRADVAFMIGRCLHVLDHKQKAIPYYRKALARDPNNLDAAYMLALLEEGKPPSLSIPRGLLEEQFNRLAPVFRRDYVTAMAYSGHTAMERTVVGWISEVTAAMDDPSAARFDVVDVGCGVGLCGERVRMYARNLIGVDIAKEMLRHIPKLPDMDRTVYDKLYHEEAVHFLKRYPARTADIVMAAGVFNYLGALDDAFAAAAHVLRPGGIFAFSVESLPKEREGEGVGWLTKRGTFGHSLSYLDALATQNGMERYSLDHMRLYTQAPGMQLIYRMAKTPETSAVRAPAASEPQQEFAPSVQQPGVPDGE